MRTAVGVFDPFAAGRIIDDLSRIGCSKQRMSIIAHPPSPEAPAGPAELSHHIGPLHEASMTGVGYVFVAGPLGDLFAGADLGAALIASGLTEEEASRYVDEVNQGSTIVAAEVDEGHLQEVLNLMSTSAHGRAMGMPGYGAGTPSGAGGPPLTGVATGAGRDTSYREPISLHPEKVTIESVGQRPPASSSPGKTGTWEKIKTTVRRAFEGKKR